MPKTFTIYRNIYNSMLRFFSLNSIGQIVQFESIFVLRNVLRKSSFQWYLQ